MRSSSPCPLAVAPAFPWTGCRDEHVATLSALTCSPAWWCFFSPAKPHSESSKGTPNPFLVPLSFPAHRLQPRQQLHGQLQRDSGDDEQDEEPERGGCPASAAPEQQRGVQRQGSRGLSCGGSVPVSPLLLAQTLGAFCSCLTLPAQFPFPGPADPSQLLFSSCEIPVSGGQSHTCNSG